MENNLLYSVPAGATNYLNLGRDLSRVNSKNEELTTRDGHVFGYMVELKFIGSNATIYSAPNSWKMRNSFRKFDAYRDIMFKNVGATGEELGKYGKTIRPFLDKGHATPGATELTPITKDSSGNAVTYDGGEWSYTRLAVTPTYVEGPTPSSEEVWADAFTLHICEENEVQGADEFESGTYKSVGMIHSYNIDRQDVSTPEVNTGETITGPSNPLAQLISSGNQAAGEVIDIVEDQELELPPYDLENNGDSIHTIPAGIMATTAEFPVGKVMAFLPAGLARLDLPGAATMHVKVIGKLLCKDMA